MALALEIEFAIFAAVSAGVAPPACASIAPERLMSASVRLSPGKHFSRMTAKSSGSVKRE